MARYLKSVVGVGISLCSNGGENYVASAIITFRSDFCRNIGLLLYCTKFLQSTPALLTKSTAKAVLGQQICESCLKYYSNSFKGKCDWLKYREFKFLPEVECEKTTDACMAAMFWYKGTWSEFNNCTK